MSEQRSGELTGLRVALVGPGRVGASLVHWVRACGASVEMVAARTAESRDRVAEAAGARAVAVSELVSEGCDLLLVAVADTALDEVARVLGRRPQAAVALHTAGARGASALAPLAGSGRVACGTFHPLKAFPEPLTDLDEARGTFFALDGGAEAVTMGRRLARAFGGSAEVVAENDRPLYHLAASVAAGGVATLAASAAELAREVGLPDGVGRGYLTLASGALARLAAAADEAMESEQAIAPTLGAAITGPVARGDFAAFARQLATLETSGEAGRRRHTLFVDLAEETVRLTRSEASGGADARGDEAVRELRRAVGRALEEAGEDRAEEPHVP